MGSSAKWYCVLGAGSVTGMFTCRELLQRGGNVRACCRNPDTWRSDIESLVAYFPRGKRGILEFVAADVTKAETLGAAVAGCEAVIFTASGSAWSGPGSSYDVDYKGVELAAAAAKAAGVRKFILVSCFMVSDRSRFSLTRFFMNVGPKWRMMDHKWAGECALRASGLPYTILRPGALFLTQDGAGGSTGVGFVVTATQGSRGERGRISKSDLAGVCASCALDFQAGLNATFNVAQVEPPVRRQNADDGTRYVGLRRMVADTASAPVEHLPWFGLLGVEKSTAASEALQAAAVVCGTPATGGEQDGGDGGAATETDAATTAQQ